MMVYPLAIGGVCIIASIIGTFFVSSAPARTSWARSTRASSPRLCCRLSASRVSPNGDRLGTRSVRPASASTAGCVPLRLDRSGCDRSADLGHRVLHRHRISSGTLDRQASTTGHGTNVIQGLAISMEATAVPALIICARSSSFMLAGLFGIAIAVTTHAGPGRHGCALDAYGPVTDNAGGIAEMADLTKRCVRPPTRWTPSATPPRR